MENVISSCHIEVNDMQSSELLPAFYSDLLTNNHDILKINNFSIQQEHKIASVRSEVLTAVKIQVKVFWVVTSSSGGPYCLLP
jgi:ABC-type transporter MlaC component